MSLSHFSKEPYIRHLYSRSQKVDSLYRSSFGKPQGFWVSVDGDDDWEDWCRGAEFGIGSYRHQVHLARDAKILHLKYSDELISFRNRYMGIQRWGENNKWSDIYIRWEDVAKDYQGVIIAPYQWSCRMEENWYYGWDCASGCIWDVSAIYCVEPVREAA